MRFCRLPLPSLCARLRVLLFRFIVFLPFRFPRRLLLRDELDSEFVAWKEPRGEDTILGGKLARLCQAELLR